MHLSANNSSLKNQLSCTILYNYEYFKNITPYITNLMKYNYICTSTCNLTGFFTRYHWVCRRLFDNQRNYGWCVTYNH